MNLLLLFVVVVLKDTKSETSLSLLLFIFVYNKLVVVIAGFTFLTREHAKRNERVIGMDKEFTRSLARSITQM